MYSSFRFNSSFSREHIREFCRITHKNDEAYVGALAVVLAIRTIIADAWDSNTNLLEIIARDLPDTRVRDRIIEIAKLENASITEVAKLGVTGFVAESIPFALFAASQIKYYDFETIIRNVVSAGGDTDTNASLTGQIAGSWLGIGNIPRALINKLADLSEYVWINEMIAKMEPVLAAY